MSIDSKDGRAADYTPIDFTWKPLGHWVFVQPDPPLTTVGTIILPDDAQEEKRTGTVIEIGDGRWNPYTQQYEPLRINPGDRVLFGEYSGQEIKVDGVKCKLMRIDEIQAYKRKEDF